MRGVFSRDVEEHGKLVVRFRRPVRVKDDHSTPTSWTTFPGPSVFFTAAWKLAGVAGRHEALCTSARLMYLGGTNSAYDKTLSSTPQASTRHRGSATYDSANSDASAYRIASPIHASSEFLLRNFIESTAAVVAAICFSHVHRLSAVSGKARLRSAEKHRG